MNLHRLGKCSDMRLDNGDPFAIAGRQPFGDFQGRAFPQIVDIGFEAEAETGSLPFWMRIEEL